MSTIKPTSVPSKRLAASITAASMAMQLNNIEGWDGNNLTSADFGSVAYAVLRNSDNSAMEIIEFDPSTIASASITILRRGLKFTGDLTTEVSANKLTWIRNDTIVELGTHVPQLLNTFMKLIGDETVAGVKTFSSSPVVPTPSGNTDAANKAYADSIANAGAADANTTTKGIVEEATQAEVDAGTAAGGTSARLAVNPSTLRSKQLSDYVASDTGAADAYVIAPSPVFTAYAAGQRYIFKAANANTGASTINVNSLGVKSIKKNGTLALAVGDIVVGQIVELMYDGTNMQMLTPTGTVAVPTGTVSSYAGLTAPSGYLLCDGSSVSRTTYADLFSILNPTVGTFTVTIAAPGVVTLSSHGLATGDSVYLTTTGALPTGLSANTRYWVIKNDANSFWLASSLANALAGTKITTTGSQSGTHTAKQTAYGVGDGSTTFTLPDLKGKAPVGKNTSDTEFAGLGQTGGAKTHTLTTAEMPAHTHDVDFYGTPGASGNKVSGFTSNETLGGTDSGAAKSTGGGGSHNNLQPYVTLNFIIKT